jgi:ornithine cyclodeaminase/alanine dehydrogenase-like protein (mu-crystallin family)
VAAGPRVRGPGPTSRPVPVPVQGPVQGPSAVPVLGLAEIERAARPELVLDAVRVALVAHADGATQVPPPLHLAFPEADGDCHVKAGWLTGAEHFTVKIASGFYGNAGRGLPVNQGLVCVLSARTGRAVAILDDRGMLTAWRTAAAGALVGHAMARPEASTVGVFGTGEQAFLQVSWLARVRPVHRVLVSGRTGGTVAALCRRLAEHGLDAVPGSVAGVAGADIVITTTPSATPLFDAAQVADGAHVTGIGTDMPHKNELPPALFGRATTIATDDHEQCLHHGDFGRAVRAGAVAERADLAVGDLLRQPPSRPAGAVTVADLTGVGALDAAVASLVAGRLLG